VRLLSDGSVASTKGPSLTIGIPAKALLLAACICVIQSPCRGQTNGILCTGGEGRFARTSTTGVKVIVDAQKDNGLATRACEAVLLWKKTETPVARDLWQADVDAMGVDLSLGVPVVTFQIKKSDVDSSMTYLVYSLRGPPQLLRTITGGDSFRAADTDLDGRIEIWATDAKAVSGFEGLPLSSFDFPPTVVMRFEDRRLIDVSSEFRHSYDDQIERLQSQLDPRQLSDFKKSDGKFNTIPPWETEKLRALLSTKIKVLEIVWAYLYSGRETDAWQALAERWPTADLDRIRISITNARASGISSQVDAVSRPRLQLRKLMRVHIYDLVDIRRSASSTSAATSDFPQSTGDSPSFGSIVMPEAISLYTPPPPDLEHAFPHSGVLVELVIDAAGKVSSARLMNKEDEGAIGEPLMAASSHWKFVPARRFNQAVACRIRLTVSPYQ
jgi:hypothetical protein